MDAQWLEKTSNFFRPGREVLMAILMGPIFGTAGDLRDLKPVPKHSSMQAEDTDTPGYGTA